MRARIRRMSSGGNGVPPEPTVSRLDRSVVSKFGWSSMRQYCVGTPDQLVTRCCSVSARCTAESQRPDGGIAIVVPKPGELMNNAGLQEMWKTAEPHTEVWFPAVAHARD